MGSYTKRISYREIHNSWLHFKLPHSMLIKFFQALKLQWYGVQSDLQSGHYYSGFGCSCPILSEEKLIRNTPLIYSVKKNSCWQLWIKNLDLLRNFAEMSYRIWIVVIIHETRWIMNLCKAQFVLCLSGSLKVYLGSFWVAISFKTIFTSLNSAEIYLRTRMGLTLCTTCCLTAKSTLKINQRTYTELLVIQSMDTNIAHMQHWSFSLLQHHQFFRSHHQVDWNTKLCLYQSRKRVFFRL